MKAYKTLSVYVFLFISLVALPAANACTIISASKDKTVLFGGNEDQKPKSSFLVVDKNGKLGVVYFATHWGYYPLVMLMGINEMGLAFDTNMIPTEKLRPHPERKPPSIWAIPRLMEEASTVEEVLSRIFTINWGNKISYQIHFADKLGDSVVIHPGPDGELTYTRKKSKGNDYLVSTNFNLAQLEKGDWSCPRYRTAEKMLSKAMARGELTVDFMASVLNATQRNGVYKTLFSAVYDLKNLRIYLFYDRKFDEPHMLDVKKLLDKTKYYRKISLKKLILEMDMTNKKDQ